MDISLPCPATQARALQSTNHTEMPSIPSKPIFQNSTFIPPTHAHIFFIKPGGQGMVITNQGVAILPCFQQSKHMQFYKTGQWVVLRKTRTETCIKGRD
jgi:hypothetical protein